jgi:hypothetical protein
MARRSHVLYALGLIGLCACENPAASPASATVNFVAVSQTCSSVIPVAFSLDGQPLGTDTFRIALPNPHTTSRSFMVTPGQHALGAHIPISANFGGGYVWPDQTVNLVAGATVTDSLPFYCS